jgi:hypothetical protein
MMLFLTFFLFSESDVAFVIKYQFHDSVDQPSGYETEDKNKKRKVQQQTKRHSVIEYSYVKLPAAMFAQYLENDCRDFINDCIRYIINAFYTILPLKTTFKHR